MKTAGILLLLAGIALGIYALMMDVSVPVTFTSTYYTLPDRVNNLGLMADRQNYLIFSGILSVIGVILIVVPTKTEKISNTQSTEQTTIQKANKDDIRSLLWIVIVALLAAIVILAHLYFQG